MPNSLGHVKPNHYGDMLKIAWQNRDVLPLAWKILNDGVCDGVCDGCALGTTGLHDFTMDGVHLCTVRLNLLRLNTMPPMDISALADVKSLRQMDSKELRDLGRLPYPMLRKRGEADFRRIMWDEALDTIATRMRQTDPHRMGFYLTSRGITNEVYYVAQKAACFIGTNNMDNAARICYSPSTVAMKQSLGVSASTCSYKDGIGTDLLIFIGSDTPNNQPVTTKHMYYAKQKGTKIVVINPYREPGLERYWVPSAFKSAMFGTKLGNEFIQSHTGGDLAFLNGVLKLLIEHSWLDRDFIAAHTTCFEQVEAHLAQQPWNKLEHQSGVSRDEMLRFAYMLGKARSAVFVWSMGIRQHENSVENVQAILNLGLARGFIGREFCGPMPIRGHSGVQGGGEMGCAAWTFPGGDAITVDTTRRFSEMWGFEVPAWKGLACVDMLDAAHDGELDVFYVAGGNFLETLPDPHFIKHALAQPTLRVHQDIVMTSRRLVDPAAMVILLPAATRYEQRDGGTETTTERQVIFSLKIAEPPAEARSEWEIFMQVAQRVHPDCAHLMHFEDCQHIREEIAHANPIYDGIKQLRQKGDHFQWGGHELCSDGHFKTATDRAIFNALTPPEYELSADTFILKTRRSKQFNSMIHTRRDPLNGAQREDVLLHADDANALSVREGDWVLVCSTIGQMKARVKLAKIKPRNVQVHWPEGNVLLAPVTSIRPRACRSTKL